MHHLLETWFSWVLTGGYTGIVVLMAMESSIFPVPSEIVIPPAAFLAAQGKLNPVGVVLAGTVGSYLGSAITYWASRLIGRPLIVKYGRFVLISPKKLEQAENWLARYEAGGVFFARLLPVVRHLISIPAGIVRMNFGVFSIVTIAGSALWCSILAYLGDKAYRIEPELLTNPDALVRFIQGQSRGILLVIALFAALYMLTLRLLKPRSSA
ncbi:MAG: DedA family protein [Verrucomicrobia bacterium]|nr:MAG: DedA family protein [Verrucomicrobiota bacterium]PYJ19483.1 MAG: DedA family protein [Verrucomicrobiota bacterium]PYJ27229.1 MAG: DedA family protein [Verrucomicrobiota bacterium]